MSQPTAMPPLLQGAQQHDRASDREGEAEYEAARDRPADCPSEPDAERRGDPDLHNGAGQGDRLHRHQVFEREVQTDAEHQQDDADLGQFVGEVLVGNKARCRRSDQHAGEEIADQGRNLQPLRDDPEDEGQDEANDDRRDERRVMGQGSTFLFSRAFGVHGQGGAITVSDQPPIDESPEKRRASASGGPSCINAVTGGQPALP